MEQRPKPEMPNDERFARELYHEKVKLALATETIGAPRPPVCAPGSKALVLMDGKEVPIRIVEEEAGVYLIKIAYPNGAEEWGSCLEEEIISKLN